MITQLLTQLHMQVNETETGWDVLPPGFRYDINQDVDLIEEIARFHGYDNIPLHHPQSPVGFLAQKETERGPKDWRSCLVGRGYHEAVCYTFVDPKMQQLLEPRAKALALNNPISADLSVMRTSLWAGLLQAVLHNQNRQNNRVRLFEMGKRFVQINGQLQQQEMLAGVITGTLQPVQWAEKKRPLDFYDIKGDIEAILDLTGNIERFSFAASEHSALHPGQSSKLIYNGNVAGWMGALHPQIQQALDLSGPVYLFEIEQDALRNAELSVFEKLSRFPAISRDLALTLKDGVTAADIQQVIHRAAGSLLTDSTIFDVYRGKGICDGHKSVAVTLTLQDKERTLVDAEVNELMNRVVQALKQEVEASLRE